MPATRFLFWNIGKRPLSHLVAELAREDEVDVIVLAECAVDPGTMLEMLNPPQVAVFHYAASGSKQIAIYTRFIPAYLQPIFDSDRLSIRSLELPAREPILLAAAHLPSKLHWSEGSQALECVELNRRIEDAERMVGHARTVLVGDFNMNPFEEGIVSSVALNSVMSRQIASRITRTVQGRTYRFFYNPMWNYFGDAQGGTAGSYYYDAGEHVNYYWHLFDQLLLRPELADRFDLNQLKIVKATQSISLIQPDGRPDRISGSDHLPLIFEVEF